MKKIIQTLVVSSLLFSGVAVSSAASEISVKINGQVLSFDQHPVSINGRTLVPLRGIFEALGAELQWDPSEQIIDAYKDGRILFRTKIGWLGAYVGEDSKEISLDVAPQIINGRTMVPVRFVGEAAGASVTWDVSTKTVHVSTDEGYVVQKSQNNYDASAYINYLSKYIPQYTSNQLQLTEQAIQKLTEDPGLYFSKDRDMMSVDKNANKYFADRITIEDITRVTMDNNDILTIAIGYTGGKINPITEIYENQTYYQMFYFGSNNVKKGDSVTARGIFVGNSIINLVNNLTGLEYQAPIHVMVAGDFYNMLDEYFYLKELGKKEGVLFDEETKERLGLGEKKYEGEEGLVQAAEEGRLEIVKALIQSGIDKDSINQKGNTALISACLRGNKEVVQYLLQIGADIKTRQQPKGTGLFLKYDALMAAVFSNSTEIVKLLLDSGANPNVSDSLFKQPLLQQAIDMGNKDIIKLLLDNGADPSIKNKDDMDTLQYLVYPYGRRVGKPNGEDTISLVKMVLNKGLDPKPVYNHLKREWGRSGNSEVIDIIELLEDAVESN
ncbi:stalk domain-containing protein [Ammoniphilus sp. CFH 90114]|uniref:stalk domain-containing protein n=1 Tax=Ammoniphilus sp. CFH 90114 TaxID=2493665 RepID=UPI00100EC0F6|nr:stalk domain-containing protein [Ammoniphilus sp. CFH 90114]RXT08843.1 hypothetical protein EIZ39_08565 [Ammoniphilus sp. CFH 90114]